MLLIRQAVANTIVITRERAADVRELANGNGRVCGCEKINVGENTMADRTILVGIPSRQSKRLQNGEEGQHSSIWEWTIKTGMADRRNRTALGQFEM
jgi:hypothetical protein